MCNMTLRISMDYIFLLGPVFSIELPIPPRVKSRWPKQSNMVLLALGNQRFPVRARLPAMCGGELSVAIARLMSKCLCLLVDRS